MKVTEVKLNILKDGKTKAIGSITLDGEFAVSGISLREGANGLFVAMPGRKGADDKYYDTAFPLNKELRAEINTKVKKAYEDMLGKEKGQARDDDLPDGFIRIIPDDYLRNAEMSLEDDFDMIDGIINNGPKSEEEVPFKDRLLNDAKEKVKGQEVKPARRHMEREEELYV